MHSVDHFSNVSIEDPESRGVGDHDARQGVLVLIRLPSVFRTCLSGL